MAAGGTGPDTTAVYRNFPPGSGGGFHIFAGSGDAPVIRIGFPDGSAVVFRPGLGVFPSSAEVRADGITLAGAAVDLDAGVGTDASGKSDEVWRLDVTLAGVNGAAQLNVPPAALRAAEKFARRRASEARRVMRAALTGRAYSPAAGRGREAESR